jgi:cytochrome c
MTDVPRVALPEWSRLRQAGMRAAGPVLDAVCVRQPDQEADMPKIAARSATLTALLACACTLPVAHAAPDVTRATQLAAQHACLGCHAADKKLVGPSYQDVAAKYKDDAGARAHLAQKIKAGGAGVWGPVPMPPNPGLSDADVQVLVDWVLAGAPSR